MGTARVCKLGRTALQACLVLSSITALLALPSPVSQPTSQASNSLTIKHKDADILLQFKDSMQQWCNTTALLSWNQSTALSEWEGVQVSAVNPKVVTGLNLANKGLCGPLPAILSKLSALTGINLANNSFTGNLPEAWSKLSSLIHLNLHNNLCSGTLPDAWATLANLATLHLGNNQLSGPLPPSFGELQGLISLSLEQNSFNDTLPDTWSQLTRVTALTLGGNSLNGPLPESWSNLQRVSILALQRNLLEGTLPGTWSQLVALGSLYLSSNKLTGSIPAEWTASAWWNTIRFVDISQNRLSGFLPPFPPQAIYFKGSSNQFTGPLQQIPSLLMYLDLADNRLEGSIPDVDSTTLVALNLSSNYLQALPSRFHAPNAQLLAAAKNSISGPLPTWPDHSLAYCDLSENMLTGPLTEDWTKWDWIFLSLDNNRLAGALPDIWEGSVQMLLLQQNKFKGCLPKAWPKSNATASVIALANNDFSDCSTLPDYADMLSSLDVIDVAGCHIPSLVPLTWVNGTAFNNLTVLNVGELWDKSADHSTDWRKAVCISNQLRNRLDGELDQRAVLGKVQGSLLQVFSTPSLAAMNEALASQGVDKVLVQFPDVQRRLSKLQPKPAADAICQNKQAWLIVFVQWSLVVALMALFVVLYVAEVNAQFVSISWRQMGNACSAMGACMMASKPIIRVKSVDVDAATQDLHAPLIPDMDARAIEAAPANPETHALVEAHGDAETHADVETHIDGASHITIPSRDSLAIVRRVCNFTTIFAISMLVMNEFFYWYDIILDIQILAEVWGDWPSYPLTVVLVFHYILASFVIAWRVGREKPWYVRFGLGVLILPCMPVLDTVALLVVSVPASWLPAVLQDTSIFDWQDLFLMRDACEVFLEAVPTSIIQSIVLVQGNKPSVGWYLDDDLYIMSAVGSCVNIIRVFGTILQIAAKANLSPWHVASDMFQFEETCDHPSLARIALGLE